MEQGPNFFAETKVHKEQLREEYGHHDIDPVIVKKMYVHERLAEEMKQSEIDCEALPLARTQLNAGSITATPSPCHLNS